MKLFNQVKDIIVSTLGCDEALITETANIKDDLGADSLAVVELVMALEDAFSISISEEKLKEINTVGDIVELVQSK
ncbi:MAG: acyl carrier protein [Oscillospiraceae bacterium]|jgi:acyl carrier protein|nr:acyl carrier protein [Oscillospiraceae bacterium]